MMEVQTLDYFLVPGGLMIMVGYHLWLLYMITKQPTKTVIGLNAINRRLWIHSMMEESKNGVLPVQSIRNNIMASTVLASTAIMLSSVIAIMMTPGRDSGGGAATPNALDIVFGNRSQLGSSIKYFSILVCFLLAFLLNIQSIRYYSHTSILVNVPLKKLRSVSPQVTIKYVGTLMNRGGYFWSLGLRAFYFSFPLFLWIFGPIPMFISCILLVIMLYFLDVTMEFRAIDHNTISSNDDVEAN